MIRIEGAVIIVVEVIIKNDDLKLILVLSFQRLCISPVLVYFSDGEPGTSAHSLHQGVGTVLHNHSILQPGNKRNGTLKTICKFVHNLRKFLLLFSVLEKI